MVSKKEYVQKHREKLKAKGYVKREVWIPPKYTQLLKQFELSVRKGVVPNFVTNQEEILVMSTTALYESLTSYGLETGVLETEFWGEVIQVTVADAEEFPIFVSVGEQQILAVMPLLNVEAVDEPGRNRLNKTMLEMNTMVPLSDFAIVNGQYVLFGALSVNSNFDEIVEEILTLAGNVEGALELIDEVLD